jgi:hypothetical protein
MLADRNDTFQPLTKWHSAGERAGRKQPAHEREQARHSLVVGQRRGLAVEHAVRDAAHQQRRHKRRDARAGNQRGEHHERRLEPIRAEITQNAPEHGGPLDAGRTAPVLFGQQPVALVAARFLVLEFDGEFFALGELLDAARHLEKRAATDAENSTTGTMPPVVESSSRAPPTSGSCAPT